MRRECGANRMQDSKSVFLINLSQKHALFYDRLSRLLEKQHLAEVFYI